MNAPKSYSNTISVPSLVTDTRDRLSVPGTAKLFEELAWKHARDLGVDFTDGGDHFWVLSRLRVRFDSIPKWSDEIVLETWPSGVKKLFACREFRLSSADGQVMVRATSRWLVMSASTGRPVPPQRAFDLSLIPTTEAVLDEEPEKLAPQEHTQAGATVTVRYSDLDRNRHTNNTRYITWMLDALSPEVLERHTITDFDVSFTAESHYGDALTVHDPGRSSAPAEFRPHIVRDRDDSVVALGRYSLVRDARATQDGSGGGR
jgi:acyl-ACP thioesterase